MRSLQRVSTRRRKVPCATSFSGRSFGLPPRAFAIDTLFCVGQYTTRNMRRRNARPARSLEELIVPIACYRGRCPSQFDYLVAVLLALTVAPPASAQHFPSRPVRLIVPY